MVFKWELTTCLRTNCIRIRNCDKSTLWFQRRCVSSEDSWEEFCGPFLSFKNVKKFKWSWKMTPECQYWFLCVSNDSSVLAMVIRCQQPLLGGRPIRCLHELLGPNHNFPVSAMTPQCQQWLLCVSHSSSWSVTTPLCLQRLFCVSKDSSVSERTPRYQ